MKKTVFWFFVFITLLLLFSFSLSFVSFTFSFYEHEFTTHDVYSSFPEYTTTFIHAQTQELLDYLRGENDILDTTFFNLKEQEHLRDVKHLFGSLSLLFYASFFLFLSLFFIYGEKTLGKLFITTGLTAVGITLLFFLTFKFAFDSLFLWFHNIAFTNTLWLLTPGVDNLIAFFPEVFFYDMALYTLLIVLGLSSSMLIVGLFMVKHKI